MHPLLLTLLIDELFTHSISLSITAMLMGTFSITLSIVIIDPQKSTIPITPITDDPNFIHYHFITHYWDDKVSITQFLSVFCPHFHYPFITAESKQLLDFQ